MENKTGKLKKALELGYTDHKMDGKRLFWKWVGLAVRQDKIINEKLSGSDLGGYYGESIFSYLVNQYKPLKE